MASMVVLEHVLRKISAATLEDEAVGAAGRIIFMEKALTSFKARVAVFQEMADLGQETFDQMVWRKRVVSLACRMEDFIDSSNLPLKDLNLLCCFRITIKCGRQLMYNEISRGITKLRQEQPEYSMGASTSESNSFEGISYDPCLPLPAAETDLPGVGQASEKLARLLLDGEKHLKAVSIVGFAGLGKRTLAVKVYSQIEAYFEFPALATVSRKPNMKQLLQHISAQLRPEAPECSEASPEQLINEIREHLLDKR
jgi:hypothetical protein